MGQQLRAKQIAVTAGRKAYQKVVELLFPPLCLLCDGQLDVPFEDAMYCWNCRKRHLTALSSACYRCGARLPYRIEGERKVPMVPRQSTAEGCPDCRKEKWTFSRTVSLGTYFGRWREHVYEIKRRNHHVHAYQAGKMLAYPLLQAEWFEDYDALVPMPSHFWRYWQRGFNPAEEIALGVSYMTDLPVIAKALYCYRYTEKQGQLSRSQRLLNVRDSVRINKPQQLAGKSVVLIDDVMTTGTSMNQLAKLCRKAGAKRVAVAVVARAGANI